jgi:hypothetical protein
VHLEVDVRGDTHGDAVLEPLDLRGRVRLDGGLEAEAFAGGDLGVLEAFEELGSLGFLYRKI